VDAALGLGGRHALHAVAARLELQLAVAAVADHADHHFLEAADFARAFAHQLAAPALALGVARVHAQQVAGEQGRLVAAGAGPDFQERVAHVIRVLGQQQLLQFVFQPGQLGLDGRDLLRAISAMSGSSSSSRDDASCASSSRRRSNSRRPRSPRRARA
jgi:hypothetical protein